MKVLITLMLALSSLLSTAQEAYLKKEYQASNGYSLNYRFLEPQKNNNRNYPLVIVLHGAGERGDDNTKQLTHGGEMFLNPVNREYPAYVLFPQCLKDEYWAYLHRPKSFIPSQMPLSNKQTPIFIALDELIDRIVNQYAINKRKIYIIGISMGAMGTYDLVSRYPERFAAAVPICGTVNPLKLKSIQKTAFRIFHGDADNVVPCEGSREAYLQLKRQEIDVEYFEFPGCNHASWHPAFNDPDLMKWLFKQKR